ncbi:MAG: hypothetical protein QNJ37_09450 [Crocosphaera sp.]|nr:hypothetical protein [Crocosphaera sp.]
MKRFHKRSPLQPGIKRNGNEYGEGLRSQLSLMQVMVESDRHGQRRGDRKEKLKVHGDIKKY